MTTRAVEAVVFDFNGVLTRAPTQTSLLRLQDLAGLDRDTLFDGYWRHRPAYDRGLLDAHSYWTLIGNAAKHVYSSRCVAELVRADAATWGRANTPVVRLFTSVAARGARAAILSNMPWDIWHLLERRLAWIAAADVTTLSFAVGTAKPDPGIYHRCLEDLAVAPSRALFVDDRVENVEAAEEVGIRSLLYRTPNALKAWLELAIEGRLADAAI